jgi:regulator of replication initiation timing
MDDEGHETGLGGLAWYQLGRMSAETDRVRSEAVDGLLKRRRPQMDLNAVLAENHALAAENTRLRQALADYELNYANLKAWANRAEARINELLKDRE